MQSLAKLGSEDETTIVPDDDEGCVTVVGGEGEPGGAR
jgi:hypothetical protein